MCNIDCIFITIAGESSGEVDGAGTAQPGPGRREDV